MGFPITFVRNHTKPDGPKPTFCDASSRTSFLKRIATQKKPTNITTKKSMVDANATHHTVSRLRNSGGIPKKCNLNTS